MKIGIVIPAYNEEKRIGNTLQAYSDYFEKQSRADGFAYEFIVVLNGCKDNTLQVVQTAANQYPHLTFINLTDAGKGLAIKAGFSYALGYDFTLIGFVDADMATEPKDFYDLVQHVGKYDGVIASRYLPESKIYPPRPAMKKWGRKIFYNGLTRLLFGLKFVDLQCGAKIFKRSVVAAITPELMVKQWAFDVELLYLAKKHGFIIHEEPTVWTDKEGSKLQPFRAGMRMLWSLIELRFKHSPFGG
jgi:glycosyltransferase involved in cell wall biosynthesis